MTQMASTHVEHANFTEEDHEFPHLTTAAMWVVGTHHMNLWDVATLSNGVEEYRIVRTR